MRILNKDSLISHGNLKGRKDMYEILEAGLLAGDPYYNTKSLFKVEGDKLIVGGKDFEPANDPRSGMEEYDLNKIDRILVVGAGKGAQRVGLALEEVLGDRLTGGHIIGKHGDEIILKKIGVTLGGHPTPDQGCVDGSRKILALSKDMTERDLVITIAANGVSSLLTLPVDGITIDEVKEMTYMMQIEKGVPTGDLNAIRNHIDQLKGGRISRVFQPAKMVHLVIIDPNHTSVAGTTADYNTLVRNNRWLHNLPEGSTFKDAADVLTKWDAWEKCPKSIADYIRKAPPEGETVRYTEFEKMDFRIFGVMPGSRAVQPAAMKKAEELGYKTIFMNSWLQAEGSQAGIVMAQIARTCELYGEPFKGPVALFSRGELLVTVGDQKGVGGRNQEYCLAAVKWLAGSEKVVIGSVDTDGTDGPGGFFAEGAPTCLAGGIVDGYTQAEADEKGVDIVTALKTHGTSAALWALGSGVDAEHNISLTDLTVTLIME